jgi:DNA replication initiation complex subunit (GINS family)
MDALHPAKVKPDAKLPDSKTIDALVRSLKYTEERIRAQMKSLGIAREDKLKNRAQIKSTPFALIAGYMDELERMTPQQAMSLENEERKLYAIVKERINKFYVSLAPDIVAEEEDDDGSLSSLDVERIVADLDIEM